jgi:hypothetical protein
MRGVVAIAALAMPATVWAQSSQGDVSVTIYSEQALVDDTRVLTLPTGEVRHEFRDVSAAIRPETVTLQGDGIEIAEQNFDFDLLSPAALMQKSEGQTITLIRRNPATGTETAEQAEVLAVNGGVVMRVNGKVEVLRDDGQPVRVVFDDIPPNLRARPTLSVTFDSTASGTRPLRLSYLTTGLGWNADYVGVFDEKKQTMDLQGWVTLTNTTGTPFPDAEITLAAGDVVKLNQQAAQRRNTNNYNSYNAGYERSEEDEAVGDLYLYPIEGRSTIATNQKKQIGFLDATGVAAKRTYRFTCDWLCSSDEPQSAESIIDFNTGKRGGLGRALPAGVVRVYMRDANDKARFVGESRIAHTPAGSDMKIVTGYAFDVKVKRIVEKREPVTADEWSKTAEYRVVSDAGVETVTVNQRPTYQRTEMRYVVTNARDVPVTVEVVQDGLNGYARGTRVTKESLDGTQRGAWTRVWQVPVPAGGKTELTVTFLTDF